jgi:ribosomal protein S18 acetylase RimI-like enzyme
MNLSIRQADVSDFKIISALAVTTFYEAYFEQDPSINLADYVTDSFSLKKVKDELEDKNLTFFIAEVDKKAVGYAKLRENSEVDCVKNENSVELQRIYILEKVKGKNVGKMLMQKCIEQAKIKGFEMLWLGVWSQNFSAQRFYGKLGFERIGEMDFEYGSGIETNFVMQIEL